jgi:hypothetical protein
MGVGVAVVLISVFVLTGLYFVYQWLFPHHDHLVVNASDRVIMHSQLGFKCLVDEKSGQQEHIGPACGPSNRGSILLIKIKGLPPGVKLNYTNQYYTATCQLTNTPKFTWDSADCPSQAGTTFDGFNIPRNTCILQLADSRARSLVIYIYKGGLIGNNTPHDYLLRQLVIPIRKSWYTPNAGPYTG